MGIMGGAGAPTYPKAFLFTSIPDKFSYLYRNFIASHYEISITQWHPVCRYAV